MGCIGPNKVTQFLDVGVVPFLARSIRVLMSIAGKKLVYRLEQDVGHSHSVPEEESCAF